MQIINKNAEDLRPNPWNTNHVDPENEEKLVASLERNGWVRPVVCRELEDGTLEILGGEHRVLAAQKLGWQVPVVNMGREVSDTRAKEIGLIDNARYGNDDAVELAELLQDMGNSDELTEFLPYTDADLQQIFSSVDIALDDLDTEPEDEEEPKQESKPPKTHSMMRFKVPVEDAEEVSEIIQAVMKEQGFTESDSLTNAGDALTHVVKLAKKEGLI